MKVSQDWRHKLNLIIQPSWHTCRIHNMPCKTFTFSNIILCQILWTLDSIHKVHLWNTHDYQCLYKYKTFWISSLLYYHLAKTKQYVWSVSLRTCSIKQSPLGKSWLLNICVKWSDFYSHQASSPDFKGSNSERKWKTCNYPFLPCVHAAFSYKEVNGKYTVSDPLL